MNIGSLLVTCNQGKLYPYSASCTPIVQL